MNGIEINGVRMFNCKHFSLGTAGSLEGAKHIVKNSKCWLRKPWTIQKQTKLPEGMHGYKVCMESPTSALMLENILADVNIYFGSESAQPTHPQPKMQPRQPDGPPSTRSGSRTTSVDEAKADPVHAHIRSQRSAKGSNKGSRATPGTQVRKKAEKLRRLRGQTEA